MRNKTMLGTVIRAAVIIITMLGMVGGAQAERSLYRYQGFDVLDTDLSPELRQALFEAENEHYNRIDRLIRSALIDEYLQKRAKKEGKKFSILKQQVLAVPAPTEQELKKFYDANRARIPVPLEQARGELVRYLSTLKEEEKRKSLVALIKAEGKFEMLLPKPIAPRVLINSNGYPSKGNSKAKVTIVEFADYQCPHCKTAAGEMKTLMKRYADRVKLVYMDFPINRSGISTRVAEGAVCADQQGKFWGYHDTAFARQSSLTNDSPLNIAKYLKLDEGKFTQCIKSASAKTKVAKAKAEAKRLGINSTPTIFVNGERLVIQDFQKDIGRAIDRALTAK